MFIKSFQHKQAHLVLLLKLLNSRNEYNIKFTFTSRDNI